MTRRAATGALREEGAHIAKSCSELGDGTPPVGVVHACCVELGEPDAQ